MYEPISENLKQQYKQTESIIRIKQFQFNTSGLRHVTSIITKDVNRCAMKMERMVYFMLMWTLSQDMKTISVHHTLYVGTVPSLNTKIVHMLSKCDGSKGLRAQLLRL